MYSIGKIKSEAKIQKNSKEFETSRRKIAASTLLCDGLVEKFAEGSSLLSFPGTSLCLVSFAFLNNRARK